MTLRRTFLALAALLLTGFSAVSSARENERGIPGNWVFYITIDGAPPCQCIQILNLAQDGEVQGPASDRFSGDVRGEWALRGSGDRYAMTLVQNVINPDGSAGGVFVIKNTMRQTSTDTLTGEFTFQILSNGGGVVFAGKGTFKGSRVRAD
jgi:hypothetical protein